MGTFDELYCDVPLPDGSDSFGKRFQTKSFPEPCFFRYRINRTGRLIDSQDHDLEPEGYIDFYLTGDEDDERESSPRCGESKIYRAKFVSGQLQNIVRLAEKAEIGVHYGLSFFRKFASPPLLCGDPSVAAKDASPIEAADEERGKSLFSAAQVRGAKITWPDRGG